MCKIWYFVVFNELSIVFLNYIFHLDHVISPLELLFIPQKSEKCLTEGSEKNLTDNIILNYDFSEGLQSWHPNCCKSFVASASSGQSEGAFENSGSHYAVVSNRKECWQGLEQDITSRVSPGSTYTVSANVKVAGPVQGLADVLATLKLVHEDGTTNYSYISRY